MEVLEDNAVNEVNVEIALEVLAVVNKLKAKVDEINEGSEDSLPPDFVDITNKILSRAF